MKKALTHDSLAPAEGGFGRRDGEGRHARLRYVGRVVRHHVIALACRGPPGVTMDTRHDQCQQQQRGGEECDSGHGDAAVLA